MLSFQEFFEGGTTDPDGMQIEGIDIQELTNGEIQKAYADLLGTNSGKIQSKLSRAFAIADAIMMKHADESVLDHVSLSEFKEYLGYMGLWKDAVNKISWYVEQTRYSAVYAAVKLREGWSVDSKYDEFNKDFEKYFDDEIKLKLKGISIAGTAVGLLDNIFDAVRKKKAYESVDAKAIEPYIQLFNTSEEEVLLLCAGLLKDYTEGGAEGARDVFAFYGFLPCGKTLASKLVKIVTGKALKLIKANFSNFAAFLSPIGTWMKGIEAGVKINNALLNLDAVQSAAFRLEYAVKLASDFKPVFVRNANLFLSDPLSENAFTNFEEAYKVFRFLVVDEYKAFRGIPDALDESLVKRLERFIKADTLQEGIRDAMEGSSYQAVLDSVDGCILLCSTYMDDSFEQYGEAFFGFSDPYLPYETQD